MKKSLFVVAALLLTSMAFAATETMTIDITAEGLASKYNWTNSKYYLDVKLDGNISLHVDTAYDAKTGKIANQSGVYYQKTETAPADWRMYQARMDSFLITAANGALIDSIQLTYTDGKKSGTLSVVKGVNVDPAYRIASDSMLNVGGVSKVCLYAASNAEEVTAGQVRISRFRIYYQGSLQKEDPTFKFAETEVNQKIGAATYTNTLTNTSDGTVSYESSETSVATVDNNGLVTFVGEGETTITANVAATQSFNAATASYQLNVRADNWNIETFKGAENVDLSGNDTYLTTATQSIKASEATGLKWTTFLGSIRNNLGNFTDNAAVMRQRKSSESDKEPGYLVSDSIAGGIDSLSFKWNSNGTESGNWNIAIMVNNDTIGKITEAAGAKQAAGAQFTYSVGNIKKEGKFVIRIINAAPVSTGTGNTKRFCVDNIEWFSYSVTPGPGTGCANIEQEAPKAVKVLKNGVLYIYKDGKYINVLGM